jgi:hypothetical protein
MKVFFFGAIALWCSHVLDEPAVSAVILVGKAFAAMIDGNNKVNDTIQFAPKGLKPNSKSKT